MEYNTIIQIYDRLVDVSNQLHDECDLDCTGFDRALFTLRHALLQYQPINLHLSNKSLTHQLEIAESKLKECYCKRDEILRVNNELISENENLKSEINSLRKLYQKASANKMLK
jgi:hypothetical protein